MGSCRSKSCSSETIKLKDKLHRHNLVTLSVKGTNYDKDGAKLTTAICNLWTVTVYLRPIIS